jgi:hypothetical protein
MYKNIVNMGSDTDKKDRKIQERGGDPKNNPKLYNKIESPGKKYRQQDGD